jgi:hypothetical protein
MVLYLQIEGVAGPSTAETLTMCFSSATRRDSHEPISRRGYSAPYRDRDELVIALLEERLR